MDSTQSSPPSTVPSPRGGSEVGRVLDGSRVKAWTLSEDALGGLLRQLHTDPRQAGLQYERVRSKLVKLFEWRGCRFADELADETIDRVARKIQEGVEIRAEDPYRYFCSVAFFVYKEVLAEERKRSDALASPEFRRGAVAAEDEPDEESLAPCLDSCLSTLTPRSRDLVLQYHSGEKRARIDNRNRLAAELGVTINTLRLRVHRIRLRLESCVRNCAGWES